MDKINVLVLGVGGNVSQGILKALSICGLPVRVVGACVDAVSMGLYTVDKAYLSPLASDSEFVDWLIGLCKKESINIILSGVEPVLEVLTNNKGLIESETRAKCIVSNQNAINIAHDKFLTCEWLKQNKLNYPNYTLTRDYSDMYNLYTQCGFPLIAKPRNGKGSKGIFIVRDHTDLEYVFKKYKDYILQEYIGNDLEEFTVGCFTYSDGSIDSIVLQRELVNGTTNKARVVQSEVIKTECEKIVKTLGCLGPCNVQLRMSNKFPVCIEINARFSGTTPIRARFGFNEVTATLQHYLLDNSNFRLPKVSDGIAVRYMNEVYIDENAYSLLNANRELDAPNKYCNLVETYGV